MKTAGTWISLCLIVLAALALFVERDHVIVISDAKSTLICVEEEPDAPPAAYSWQDWLRMPRDASPLEHRILQRGKDIAISVYQNVWEPMSQLFRMPLDL